MNSGSSALISTGGQSASTLTSSSCSQMSRPAVQAIGAPVRRTTSTFSSPLQRLSASSVFFLSGIGLPPRTPSSAVMMNLELQSSMRPGEAVGREAAEHHRMHGADARAGQHGVGGLGDHRQVDGDAVALLDAVGLEHVGELAHPLVQLAVGDLLVVGGVVALPDDGDLVAARLQVPVDAVGRHVERAVLVPLDRDVVGRVGGVLDLGVGLDPVDALAHLAPEPVRVLDRALVHREILLVVDVGPGRPFGGNVVDLVGHAASSRPAARTGVCVAPIIVAMAPRATGPLVLCAPRVKVCAPAPLVRRSWRPTT